MLQFASKIIAFWIVIHLLPFSFLFMGDLKANSIFYFFFFKSIHDGIDLKFLKR